MVITIKIHIFIILNSAFDLEPNVFDILFEYTG